MEITSLNNEKVKNWKKLKQKKYRDLTNTFLVEGDHLVNEAIKNKRVIEIITTKMDEYEADTYHVDEKIMKELSSQVTSTDIIAVVKKNEERGVLGNIIILDNIQDPGNMGTIIRSAVAFGFDSVVISDTAVDAYNEKVVRSSEGMLFNINIIRTDIKEFIKHLSDEYKVVSTDVVNGKNIKEIDYQKIAIIIGNEGSGVSREVNELCDDFVNIKMNNNCESLNAGVSASILMYEVYNG